MPTLLEKPAENQKVPAAPPVILQSRHQWLRWRGVLIAGIVGLTATFLAVVFAPASWHLPTRMELWAGGWLITALAAALAYWFAPGSILVTARTLDERFSAKNRLEAIAIAKETDSPLARAQHDETALFLKQEPQARRIRALPWLAGGLVTLVVAHLILLIIDALPVLSHAVKPSLPPLPKETPKASIVWQSPAPETKANPVEEVPTKAIANSTTGLEGMTLEVSVNGEAKKPTPIPADPYTKPGSHEIKVSLYLDELNVQPFDIVSYYLRGQRIATQKLPDVASAIQFIQVRPFRDDVLQGAGHVSKGYDLLIRLKLAQLRAVKENFVLAHTDLPPDHPVRKKENDRVGKNQAELATRTGEVVQAMIAEGDDQRIVDLLQQAEPFMDDAGKKILATQNAAALVPQQKALNLIVEVEKFFIKAMGPVSGSANSNNPNDPFKDKQKHELTKRMQAPAGQLETLAQNQQNLSRDLNQNPGQSPAPTSPDSTPASQGNPAPGTPNQGTPSPGGTPAPSGTSGQDATPSGQPGQASQATDPFGPDAGKGTFAERQTRILQGIEVLQNGNKVFPDAVNDALASAQKDATASLQQLNAGQDEGAKEPAAAAARDLQTAITAMNATGDEETKEALAAAQQKLNDLSNQLRELAANKPADAGQQLMDLAKQVSDLRQGLQNAADRQQAQGSAKGAEQLNALAEKIRQQQFATDLAAMSKSGLDPGHATAMADRMQDLAGQTAHGLVGAQPNAQDYANVINALQRSRANLERLAEQAAQAGVKPGDHGPGTTPSAQPPAGAGQTPGQDAGKGSSPAQGQGTAPSQIQGQGQGMAQNQDQGKGQGQSQAQGQGTAPSQSQGQGQGMAQNQDQGKGQGQSQAQGQGQGQGTAQSQNQGQPGQPNGESASEGSGSGSSATAAGGGSNPNSVAGPGGTGDVAVERTDNLQKAYRDAVQNLQDQVQQAQRFVDSNNASALSSVIRYDVDTRYRDVTAANVTRYCLDLQKPLDKLILDLQALQEHAQRTEVVKTPDLDDTPPTYRPAVSDYFEAMSRDYHPPAPPADDTPTPKDNPPPADDAKP